MRLALGRQPSDAYAAARLAVEAMDDTEYCRAMEARDLLACREVIADVFDAAFALITDCESAVRTAIVDRLTFNGTIIETDTDSYRLASALTTYVHRLGRP
ncbi:hypothetical protein ACWDA7_46880 [Streptomyces sp. NPDC001156]